MTRIDMINTTSEIECPDCKHKFMIMKRYDEYTDSQITCPECKFKVAKYCFNFVRSLSIGDRITYTGPEYICSAMDGSKGTIIGIRLGNNTNSFGYQVKFDDFKYVGCFLISRQLIHKR